jgi:squalene-hopene/tetraprenyl-beta-curcumene cyclase
MAARVPRLRRLIKPIARDNNGFYEPAFWNSPCGTRSMRRISFGRILAVIALTWPGLNVPAWGDDNPTDWRQAEARRYLDERAKAWFAFGDSSRGQAETQTNCVSCHTVSPYAMARPVLRKLTGANEPTEFEIKLVAQTKLRVEHWDELDSEKFKLFYDFDERKKRESRGTESVLNAVILAFDDHYERRQSPSDSTGQAFANMWRTQAQEGSGRGSWEWLDFGLEPWESPAARYFGAALAAIAVGTAPGYYTPGSDADVDQKVRLLRNYLVDHLAEQNTFNRIWFVWASRRLDGLSTPEHRQPIVSELLEKQQADGGWRLASLGNFTRHDGVPQDEASDGYATGIVLHVLQTVGVPKDDPKIAKGLNWLRVNQEPSGAWRGSSVNKKREPVTHVGRLMSDAATAFAVLALSH